jgi:hypothetical protein
MMGHLLGIPPVEHLKTYREVMLSLSMGNGLGLVRRFHQLRLLDILFFTMAPILLAIAVPRRIAAALLVCLGIAVGAWLWGFLDNLRNLDRFLDNPRNLDQRRKPSDWPFLARMRACSLDYERSKLMWRRLSPLPWPLQDPLRLLNCGLVILLTVFRIYWIGIYIKIYREVRDAVITLYEASNFVAFAIYKQANAYPVDSATATCCARGS